MTKNLYEDRLKRDFFRLSIITLVTVIIWIGITVYRVLNVNHVRPEIDKLLSPLTPALDLDTMEKVKLLEVVPEVDWNSLQPVKPEIVLVPEATNSASPSGNTR